MLRFVSGWAGFQELFPAISSRHDFYVPFVSHSEDEISEALAEGGEILAGWSTGAHIILKNIAELSVKYERIFLFASFGLFTDYQHLKTVMLMIRKMKKDPSAVLRDFYENCGIKDFAPVIDEKTQERLIGGLEFLTHSRAVTEGCILKSENIVAVHGINDMIVNFRSGEDIANSLCGGRLITIESGHYINEQTIADIIYENTHKKIL